MGDRQVVVTQHFTSGPPAIPFSNQVRPNRLSRYHSYSYNTIKNFLLIAFFYRSQKKITSKQSEERNPPDLESRS